MLAEFTSQKSATLRMYIMKAVHHKLSVVVCKRLYDKKYPGVLCLLCREMELLDHVFTCVRNSNIRRKVLFETFVFWAFLVGTHYLFSSAVSWVLDLCYLDVGLYLVICKGFVLKNWCEKTIKVFDRRKRAVNFVIDLVERLIELHHSKVWLMKSEFRVYIEKIGLVGNSGVLLGLLCCASSVLSDNMVRFLGVLESFIALSFFFGLNGSSCVNIGV
ncbi:hypothetical protein G9A89_010375 [Geosiphon pyriformis]|nr:hypothetical protein G9A89_010375 [Geosiphon pyriformis]